MNLAQLGLNLIKLTYSWKIFSIHRNRRLLLESACNAGDPGSIPGSGRSTGEGIGYPLQYSWASLVAQLAKNSSAMQETWFRSLGWEDPLEKGKATHSRVAKSRTRLSDFHFHFHISPRWVSPRPLATTQSFRVTISSFLLKGEILSRKPSL